MSKNGASNNVIRKLTDREAQLVLGRLRVQDEATRRVEATVAILEAEKRALAEAEASVRDVVAAMEPEHRHLKLDQQGGSFVLIDMDPETAVEQAAARTRRLMEGRR